MEVSIYSVWSTNKGFNAFIPWPYMDDGTLLQRVKGVNNSVSDDSFNEMTSDSSDLDEDIPF